MTANSGALNLATPTDRQIVMTRVFEAPRSLVFEAMKRPELLERWLLGPPGLTMVECENDLRSGGRYRHVWRSVDGIQMAMHGVYREVVPPERIVRTETFAFGCGPQSGEQLSTVTLTVLYPSKEARDATIASGMERGVAASYNRLDKLSATAPTQ
jgi:uncharacterized protein YndB with AHSA1/START domain